MSYDLIEARTNSWWHAESKITTRNDPFPSTDTFKILEKRRVRYVGIHWDMYGPRAEEIRTKLKDFTRYLRLLASDETMSLYEIVAFP